MLTMTSDDSKKVSDMNLPTSQFSFPAGFLRTAIFRSPLILLLMLMATTATWSQTFNCGAGTSTPSTSLACLVEVSLTPSNLSRALPGQPAPSNLPPNGLGFLSGAIGAEVSQIPLASPASGIIYTNNPTTQLPERLDQSFGPILTQRAQTIGRHNRYFAITYQYFLLQDIDSLALKNLPAIIYLNSTNNSVSAQPDFAGISQNYIQLKVHQSVGYITYGLTSRMDVSIAVPLLRVDLRDTFAVSYLRNQNTPCPSSGCPATPANQSGSRAAEATGIGDIVLAAKVNFWKLRRAERDHGGFSMGVEVRLPSGDSKNYLGSGAYGVKPFATFSYAGHWSPHFNVGYQINGNSDLITGPFSVPGSIASGHLPNRLIYSGGVDVAVFKRLTVNVDGIAQRVIDAPRATLLFPPYSLFGGVTNFSLPPVVKPFTGSYTEANAAGGIKWNPFKGLLLSGNVSVKLNQAGLRSRVVPLMGASYTF